MTVAQVMTRPGVTPPLPGARRLLRYFAEVVRHTLCGLRGHVYVLHSAPGHLALSCFACGAQTRGWTIDVRPAFRRADPPRARVALPALKVPLDTPNDTALPLRPAA